MTRHHLSLELRGAVTIVLLALIGLLAVGYLGDLWSTFDLASHLRVHVSAALLVLALLLFALRARRRAAAGLIIGVAGLVTLVIPLYANAVRMAPGPSDLKLISFNMLFVNESPSDVVALLEAERPDVAFILEAPTLFPYLDRLARTFAYRSGCTRALYCDLLVLARRPMEDVDRPGPDAGWDRYVVARMPAGNAIVNVAAVHFSKPYEGGEHWHEMGWVSDVLAERPGPTILAGDFNLAPWSATARVFAEANDLKLVEGYRPTWPGPLGWLGFPIDHIMVRGIQPTAVNLLDESYGSNHRGLIATFAVGE